MKAIKKFLGSDWGTGLSLLIATALLGLAIWHHPTPHPSPFVTAEEEVVKLVTPNGKLTFCSGVIVSEDGAILTNRHCIDDHVVDVDHAVLKDGRTFKPALLWESTPGDDLALLKIDAHNLPHAELRLRPLQLGEYVFSIGHPLQLTYTLSQGHVANTEASLHIGESGLFLPDLVQTDLDINPGNSGGGLFDKDGKLVGITNASVSGTLLSFAVPSRVICKMLVSCREGA